VAEASGFLVVPLVFKTRERRAAPLAGSIPVRLRHQAERVPGDRLGGAKDASFRPVAAQTVPRLRAHRPARLAGSVVILKVTGNRCREVESWLIKHPGRCACWLSPGASR
jgi:hypothetical protein